jgi:hypothetical protein
MDALQIAALAALGAGGLAFAVMRLRGPDKTQPSDASPALRTPGAGTIEERVAVLERIATDRSIGLADEIEALRDAAPDKTREQA